MPVQRHNVVIPREDGGVEVHPLKEWLRQHSDILPGLTRIRAPRTSYATHCVV